MRGRCTYSTPLVAVLLMVVVGLFTPSTAGRVATASATGAPSSSKAATLSRIRGTPRLSNATSVPLHPRAPSPPSLALPTLADALNPGRFRKHQVSLLCGAEGHTDVSTCFGNAASPELRPSLAICVARHGKVALDLVRLSLVQSACDTVMGLTCINETPRTLLPSSAGAPPKCQQWLRFAFAPGSGGCSISPRTPLQPLQGDHGMALFPLRQGSVLESKQGKKLHWRSDGTTCDTYHIEEGRPLGIRVHFPSHILRRR